MNDQQMVEAFLAKQAVTTCPEADMLETDGTSRKRNQIGSMYNVPKLNSRQATRFTCTCGKTDSIVRDLGANTEKKNKPGYVNGIYKGNTLCQSCRKKAIGEHKNAHNKVVETERLKRELITEGNYQLYLSLRDIPLADLNKFNKLKLETYMKEAKQILELKPNKVLENRLLKASQMEPKAIDNWDDWDTPLGE